MSSAVWFSTGIAIGLVLLTVLWVRIDTKLGKIVQLLNSILVILTQTDTNLSTKPGLTPAEIIRLLSMSKKRADEKLDLVTARRCSSPRYQREREAELLKRSNTVL